MKLAVGVPTVEAFEDRVQARRSSGAGMQIWTRSFPKPADDLVRVGSLFWIVAGLMAVRQPVVAIEVDSYADGSRCARIDVEPILIRVAPVRIRPFQGWRYLEPAAAPQDMQTVDACGVERLPKELLRSLRELCLV